MLRLSFVFGALLAARIVFDEPGIVFAEPGIDYGDDAVPLVVETLEDVRALAELDGDPATFTADEQAKFGVLAMVLGIVPMLPREAPQLAAAASGGA